MKNLKLILVFLLQILINSCREREFSVELPYQGDKMVVYSLISPSEVVNVKVTKTYPPTGKITYTNGISDADVLLYENEKFIEKLKYTENGIYVSATNFKPKIGLSYSLKINSPTLPSITTNQEIIPALPQIASYNFDEKIESSLNKGKIAKKFAIKIHHDSNFENFYSIKVDAYSGNNKSGLNAFNIDQANGSDTPCSFPYINYFILDDNCFPNKDIDFKKGYELNPLFLINNEIVVKDLDKVVAQIRQFNNSYYQFCKSFYSEEGLLQAFNTPNPRYNNIKGGYGIFAAYNEVLIELPVK